jgi:hypothetical protein
MSRQIWDIFFHEWRRGVSAEIVRVLVRELYSEEYGSKSMRNPCPGGFLEGRDCDKHEALHDIVK